MEIHPLIDPFAIHYTTFAGDVYTLATAGITLTAGTLTTAALVATTADINSGTIDGTTIGGAVPAAGTFTDGIFTGDLDVAGHAAIGEDASVSANQLLTMTGSRDGNVIRGINGNVTVVRSTSALLARGIIFSANYMPNAPSGTVHIDGMDGAFCQVNIESEASEAQDISATTVNVYKSSIISKVGAGASGAVELTPAYKSRNDSGCN